VDTEVPVDNRTIMSLRQFDLEVTWIDLEGYLATVEHHSKHRNPQAAFVGYLIPTVILTPDPRQTGRRDHSQIL
jgi:hypothetical protein